MILPLALQEGRYEYKYIIDGEWTCNDFELVTTPNDDGHVNNYIQVSLNCLIYVWKNLTLK